MKSVIEVTLLRTLFFYTGKRESIVVNGKCGILKMVLFKMGEITACIV